MFSETHEVNNTVEKSNEASSDFESEIDDKYERILSGRSKEELINLRSFLMGDNHADVSDDEDKPKQKVKQRYC